MKEKIRRVEDLNAVVGGIVEKPIPFVLPKKRPIKRPIKTIVSNTGGSKGNIRVVEDLRKITVPRETVVDDFSMAFEDDDTLFWDASFHTK